MDLETKPKKKRKKFNPIKFYSTYRGKVITWCLLFLVTFLIFFAVAFLDIYNSTDKFKNLEKFTPETETESVETSLQSLFDKLNVGNYVYEYHFSYKNSNDITIMYKGQKFNNKEIGIRTFNNVATNYYIENNIIYVLENNKYIKKTNYNHYEDLDYRLLDPINLAKIIQDSEQDYKTEFKDNTTEQKNKISLEKFINIYDTFGIMVNPNGIIDKESEVSFIIKYTKENIYSISIDLTSVYPYYKNEDFSSYNLNIMYSNIGSIENIDVSSQID